MAKAIIFDDGKGQLAPLTDTRAAFDIRTGARTTLERLINELELEISALFTPIRLAELTRDRHPGTNVNPMLPDSADDGGLLLVNGRCPKPLAEIGSLEAGQSLVESSTGDVIAHRVAAGRSAREFLDALTAQGRVVRYEHHALISRPWHVRTFRDDCLMTDLVDMATLSFEPRLPGITFYGEFPISIHRNAKLYPGTILDLEHGPLVIDDGAIVRPGCIIIGPAYIGPHTTVLDRTLIKAHTSIGPSCKVAGEIGGTIFQGFANKAHDGHLGDSFIGEWSNLGAGTTNSNLLNTYGEVVAKATPGGANEKTGQQFLGCIVGDHVKTAICTRIMTGAVIHTGVMYAATAAVNGCLPPMAWVTDESPAGKKFFRFDKFEQIARTVMARRKVEASKAYMQRLREIYQEVNPTQLA